MTRGEAAGEHGLLRSAGVVSAAVLLSRVTGLVREAAMGAAVRRGAVYDAFLTGFRIPNLTRNLSPKGHSPPPSSHLRGSARHRDRARSGRTGAGGGDRPHAGGGRGLCARVSLQPAVGAAAGAGIRARAGQVRVDRAADAHHVSFLLLVALAAEAMAILNARGRFGVPALASRSSTSAPSRAGWRWGLTVGRRWPQGMIVSMAAGVVIGGALQLGWQMPSLRRAGIRSGHASILGIRAAADCTADAAGADRQCGGADQRDGERNLASGLTDAAGHPLNGPVSWLGYAFRFLQFPLGLFGAALASATLPAISRSAALGRVDEFRATLSGSLRMALLLTIPSSVGLAVLGESMIGAVYQGAVSERMTRIRRRWRWRATARAWRATRRSSCWRGLLRVGRCVDADGGEPGLDRLESAVAVGLARGMRMGQAGWRWPRRWSRWRARPRWRRVAPAHRRDRRPPPGGERGQDHAGGGSDGAACRISSVAIHAAVHGRRLPHLADLGVSIPLGVGVFYVLARVLRIPELRTLEAACYTAISHARRPEAGDPPARD